MANSIAITLNENNDENIRVTITTNDPVDGTVLNITGMTIEAFLKTSPSTADSDGTTWKGSTATSGVTITDGPNGVCEVAAPAANVTTAMTWWRVDVISSGKRKTAVYGNLTVTNT